MRKAVKEMYETGLYKQREIAEHFKIDRSYVGHIVRGKFD
jgi:predicted XRE-type DNA-binding protein